MNLKMRRDKLIKLRDRIRTLPNENFDMSVWLKGDYQKEKITLENSISCGTAVCMAGELLLMEGYSFSFTPLAGCLGGLFIRPDGTIVHHERDEAADILRITAMQAYNLFHYDAWPRVNRAKFPPTPEGAADRIDHFLEYGQ